MYIIVYKYIFLYSNRKRCEWIRIDYREVKSNGGFFKKKSNNPSSEAKISANMGKQNVMLISEQGGIKQTFF